MPGERPPVGQELDDFAEVLVRFSGSGPKAPPLFVDPRWKHAPLGYLPPALDGARCLSLLGGWLETARSRSPDGRNVHLELHLNPDGSGKQLLQTPELSRVLASPGNLSFSDDSQRAFVSVRERDGTSSIWQLPVNGNREMRLVHLTDPARQFYRPALTSDAKNFYVVLGDRQSDVWTMELKKK